MQPVPHRAVHEYIFFSRRQDNKDLEINYGSKIDLNPFKSHGNVLLASISLYFSKA